MQPVVEIVAAPIAIKVAFDLVQGTASRHERRQISGAFDVAHRFDQLPPTLAIGILPALAHPANHGL